MLIFHSKQTYVYIYIFTTTTVPQGSFTILCLYLWNHLDNTTLDRHDLTERHLTFHNDYNFWTRSESNPGRPDEIF